MLTCRLVKSSHDAKQESFTAGGLGDVEGQEKGECGEEREEGEEGEGKLLSSMLWSFDANTW